MTECAYVTERLDDYLDGALDAETRRTVSAHLDSCPRCAGEARALGSLLDDAKRLPRSVTPPPGVWTAVERRLDERAVRGRIPRMVSLRPAWLAAAAAVLVLLTATATMLAVRRSAGPPGRLATAPAAAPLDGVEAEFLTAVRELERALAERRDGLTPEALAVVEQSLVVIDSAIGEARSALGRDRGNAVLAELLWNSYRSKVDLLTRATRL